MNKIKFERNEIGSKEHKAANSILTFVGTCEDGSEKYSDLGIERLWAYYQRELIKIEGDNK